MPGFKNSFKNSSSRTSIILKAKYDYDISENWVDDDDYVEPEKLMTEEDGYTLNEIKNQANRFASNKSYPIENNRSSII
jgi:hypothetical protein